MVPTHHRNGQEPDHVQREQLVPAAGWGGVCGRVGVGSSVAEGVVSGARVRGRMRVRAWAHARACARACVRACGVAITAQSKRSTARSTACRHGVRRLEAETCSP